MGTTLAKRLSDVHPKPVAATLRSDTNVERKPFAEADWRTHIGQTIERALALAQITKQEISFAMGYQDQSAVSRWISGVERPLLDKLFAVDRFYDAWVIACAETNPRIEVTTQITIRRVA
jgi:hypothetical protein